MDIVINLSDDMTYFLYHLIILLSTFFAFLSQKLGYKKDGKVKLNKIFLSASFLVLFLPSAFRQYGVDHENYVNIYSSITNQGLNYWKYYNGFPEPLFALLNWFISITLSDFYYVYIISSFLSLLFVFKSFSYNVGKSNVAICVFLYGVTCYFYMYGLVRYSIAIGIVMFANKYFETNHKKYLLLVIIASGFHYSALFMLLVYWLVSSNSKYSYKKQMKIFFLKLGIVPLIIIIIFVFANTIFLNTAVVQRYISYFQINFQIESLNGFLWTLPIILIVLIYNTKFRQCIKQYTLYFKLLCIATMLIILSTLLPINRIVYLFFYVFYYFYGNIMKLPFVERQKKYIYILYIGILFIGGFIWVNRMIFMSIFWNTIIPYSIYIP